MARLTCPGFTGKGGALQSGKRAALLYQGYFKCAPTAQIIHAAPIDEVFAGAVIPRAQNCGHDNEHATGGHSARS